MKTSSDSSHASFMAARKARALTLPREGPCLCHIRLGGRRDNWGRSRYAFMVQLVVALLVLMTAGPAAASRLSSSGPAPGGQQPAGQQKVDRAVLDQLARKG